jgi:hypothetical protein
MSFQLYPPVPKAQAFEKQSEKLQSSNTSIVTDELISQSWMEDPDWHRYSNKLEKIAKW